MPAVSSSQQKLYGLALAIKRGKKIQSSGPAKRIAQTLAMPKIKEFAQTRIKPNGY